MAKPHSTALEDDRPRPAPPTADHPPEKNPQPPPATPPADGPRHADRIIGIGLILGGAVLLWRTFTFPAPMWDPLGMAFWPRLLIGALMLIGLVLTLRGRIGTGGAQKLDWRAFVVLGGAVLYVAVMERIGFLVTTPPFLFAAVVLLCLPVTKRRLVEAAGLAVIGTGLVYVLFSKVLLVSLPQGIW